MAQARTGFKAVSTGAGCVGNNKPTPTNHITPSPLMGEESKPVPVPDTGVEGENDAQHRHVIADLIRNPEGQGGVPTTQPLIRLITNGYCISKLS